MGESGESVLKEEGRGRWPGREGKKQGQGRGKLPGSGQKPPRVGIQGACWGVVENKWLQGQVGVGLVGTKGTSVCFSGEELWQELTGANLALTAAVKARWKLISRTRLQ